MGENTFGDGSIKLVSVVCPTCGSRLKYKPGDQSVTCPFCDNVYYASHPEHNNEPSSEGSTSHKIEGMQTPSSVLAYVEQYFDNYDWDAFAHDEDLSIDSIDRMLDKIKKVSADDYKTWVSAFLAVVVPLNKKIESRTQMFNDAMIEYKKDNADAYSMYESYKRITRYIILHFKDRVELANKYLNYAVKYGVPEQTKNELLGRIANPEVIEILKKTIFPSINEVPIIVEYNRQQEELLKQELLKEGITADSKYAEAIEFYNKKDYKSALPAFYSLRGYKESNDYIKRINRYAFSENTALITDDRVFFSSEIKKDGSRVHYALHAVEDGKVNDAVIADDLAKIICNYGGTIVYFTNGNGLKTLELATGKITNVAGKYLNNIYYPMLNLGMVYLVAKNEKDNTFTLVRLNINSLKFKKLFVFNVQSIQCFGNHIIYKNKQDDKTTTFGYDVLIDESFEISTKNIEVVGVNDNRYYFTSINPNNNNKKLYFIDKKEGAKETLLEDNIAGFVNIIDNRVYYFTESNTGYYYLISNDLDGNDRTELSSNVRNLLFKQGDWLYCVRGYGYNTVLGRMRLDGSDYKNIASQIDSFVKIDNGFIYYLDDRSDFYYVRMDGGKNNILARGVKKVLKINDDSIIYSAKDDGGESIFEIDFGKKGHRKLAYHINSPLRYDKDNIYFISKRQRKNNNGEPYEINYLKRININTYKEETLFLHSEKKKGCYIATCVYGSYDCPQVWMLRRYRDYYLDNHWWGRAFIKAYYALSPTIVKIFGKNSLFVKFSRSILNRKLKRLEKAGYEDTRYFDKY